MDYSYSRNEYIAGIFDRAAQTCSCIGPGYFTYFGQKLVGDLSINPGTSLPN